MSALDIITRTIERLGVPSGRLGNVVVVPGILGCELADGAGRPLWLIPPRVDELRLDPDGNSEAVVGRVVHPSGANFIYAPLVHVLQVSWDVLTFDYDWRKSVSETAVLLAKAATDRFGGAPFHIVAHSMGGMIARLMLRDRPGIRRGGRLVMLGTPNHGSVLAADVLTRDLDAAAFFRRFGADVPPAPALASARSWPSLYQLLPCPARDPSFRPFYENPQPGLSARHLAEAARVHALLDASPGDGSMSYVAGSLVPTVDGGEFPTLDGDGVVSHRLGLLDGVRTFLVVSDHVGLPANPLVLASITPLLHDGNAGLLIG